MEGNRSKEDIIIVSLKRWKTLFNIFIDVTLTAKQKVTVLTVIKFKGGGNEKKNKNKKKKVVVFYRMEEKVGLIVACGTMYSFRVLKQLWSVHSNEAV